MTDGIVFPQGALKPKNELKREEFADGPMMIARKGAENSKLPVAVLPVAIAYDRDPTHATVMHRIADAIGWSWFHRFFGDTIYGGAIAYGKPIPVDQLPKE